jgi:hypothetical protein
MLFEWEGPVLMLRWLIETIIGGIIFGFAVLLLNWMFKAIGKIIGSFIR